MLGIVLRRHVLGTEVTWNHAKRRIMKRMGMIDN